MKLSSFDAARRRSKYCHVEEFSATARLEGLEETKLLISRDVQLCDCDWNKEVNPLVAHPSSSARQVQ